MSSSGGVAGRNCNDCDRWKKKKKKKRLRSGLFDPSRTANKEGVFYWQLAKKPIQYLLYQTVEQARRTDDKLPFFKSNFEPRTLSFTLTF